MDWFLARAPEMGAVFVQMEDEISALAALLGGVWTGKKGLTATSGPGFSLMMEHIGLGVMLETPCVIVDVQRAGLSTGLPGRPGQGDVMQARWGSHGDYEVITLSPGTPQEMFDYTVKAFNLAERYRIPVVVLSDAYLARCREEVTIPPAGETVVEPRRLYKGPKGEYLPFKRDRDFVPPMVNIGDDHRFHVTGLTHDDRGYPIMTEECQEYNVHPLLWKIRRNVDEITEVVERGTEDAEVVIVCHGTPSKFAPEAADEAGRQGVKTGVCKLVTVWPFPEKEVARLAGKAKALVVPEMNHGQIAYEVQRCNHGKANVVFVPYGGGGVEKIDDLVSAVVRAGREPKVKKEIIEYR